jgi:carbamoyl-phosphate synthase large subunit
MPTSTFLSLEQQPPIEEVNDFFLRKEQIFLKHRNDSGGRGIVSLRKSVDWISEIMNKPSSSFHSKSMQEFLEQYRKDSKSFSKFFLMDSQEGQEYSVDVFRSNDKFIAVPRKRISVKSGVSNNVQIEKNEDLIHASKKIADLLDLRGLFGFQFIFQSSSNFSIIECNPRVQGTNIASVLAGSNLISWATMYALNRKFEVNNPRWGVFFQRTNSGELIG